MRKKQQEQHTSVKKCDFKGCKECGLYRAPKNRELDDFYWFCLKHVQEYNKNWDYYKGYTSEQLEHEFQAAAVGHRPTWKVNDLYSKRFKDPFHLFEFQDDFKKKSTPESGINATVEHLEAIRLMALQTPVTLPALKKRYKELAKKYHPDKTGGDRIKEEAFKKITAAYHLLAKAL